MRSKVLSETSTMAPGLNRRSFLSLALLATLPETVRGADLAASDAVGTVSRFYDALLANMKAAKKTDFQHRYAMLAPFVDQAFDLQTVLAVSVGPRWAGLSPDQQGQLLAAFRRYTVASYVASFDNYAGQTFAVSPQIRSTGAGQAVVESRIVPINRDTTKLDYVIKQMSSGWKIVDVLADGTISRVAAQRSDFRAVLAHGGGDALLASLQRKTSDLSDGNLA